MIIYNNNYYKSKDLFLPFFGTVLIATTSLLSFLIDENYEYTSEFAQVLDEQIFFFVDDEAINLSDKQLINIIKKQFS